VRLYAALYAIGLVVYGAVAGDRLLHPSAAPHFVYQADAWLHGHASIDGPLAGDDWAKVETVVLDDGREVSGRRLSTQRTTFLTTGDERIAVSRIKATRGQVAYVSFPEFPTLLMIPSALLSGRAGNDTIPTLLVAAAILPLCLLLLRRLAAAGLSTRTTVDDLWLVATLAFGSVLFFSAVQGKVWYTAHVVGVALVLVYAWASIEARRPIIAGLALACAAMTRTSMAFAFPLFVLEAWRIPSTNRALWRTLGRFVLPIVAVAIPAMLYNYVRFGAVTEFGHRYLDVRQQTQIEQFGLASFHYLARNLAVAFTLLPELVPSPPYIQIGGHGLALWLTTPLLLFLLWPADKPPIHRALWITVLLVALPSLLYQNSGWVQFGYRFSLDYMVFLVMLIAVGGRPLGALAKTLIVVGIAINLFGALTFDRMGWRYYRLGGNAYDVIVGN
jgi:hypothetical protein